MVGLGTTGAVVLEEFDQLQPSGEVVGPVPVVDEPSLNGFDLYLDVEAKAAKLLVVLSGHKDQDGCPNVLCALRCLPQ